jgi:hypothetical protein
MRGFEEQVEVVNYKGIKLQGKRREDIQRCQLFFDRGDSAKRKRIREGDLLV